MKRVRIINQDESVVDVDEKRLVRLGIRAGKIICGNYPLDPYVGIRDWGEFEGKAFYLDKNWDWVLGTDSTGANILVPLKEIKNET